MILDEQDCSKKIASYTRQDWQPLFALIPKIENSSFFDECAGGDKEGKGEEGVSQFSYCLPPAPLVSQFLEIVYAISIVIDFDWGEWDEGRKIARDENFDFDSIDLITKCKLITAIVRNDRFCEGALVATFKSGLILKILKSMEKEINGHRK